MKKYIWILICIFLCSITGCTSSDGTAENTMTETTEFSESMPDETAEGESAENVTNKSATGESVENTLNGSTIPEYESPKFIDRTKYYCIHYGSSGWETFYIYDAEGNLVLTESPNRPLIYYMVNDDIVYIGIGWGTGIRETRYYSAKRNLVSESFYYVVAESNELVAYMEDVPTGTKDGTIIVQNAFDREAFYKEYQVDYPGDEPYHHPVTEAVFSEDASTLTVTYESNENGEIKTKVLEVNATAEAAGITPDESVTSESGDDECADRGAYYCIHHNGAESVTYYLYNSSQWITYIETTAKPLQISMLGDYIVDISIEKEPGSIQHKYYNAETKVFSKEFFNVVASTDELVVYVRMAPGQTDPENRIIVVQNIFDRETFYQEYPIDFASSDRYSHPVMEAAFSEDGSALTVTYESDEEREVKTETLELK